MHIGLDLPSVHRSAVFMCHLLLITDARWKRSAATWDNVDEENLAVGGNSAWRLKI